MLTLSDYWVLIHDRSILRRVCDDNARQYCKGEEHTEICPLVSILLIIQEGNITLVDSLGGPRRRRSGWQGWWRSGWTQWTPAALLLSGILRPHSPASLLSAEWIAACSVNGHQHYPVLFTSKGGNTHSIPPYSPWCLLAGNQWE